MKKVASECRYEKGYEVLEVWKWGLIAYEKKWRAVRGRGLY